MSAVTEPAEELAAAWSDEDDWTDEALRLLRSLRAPHRRKRAGQIGYIGYCVLLVAVVWGVLPSMGLFLQASMGADYTRHGAAVLAAMPAGVCALALGTLLLGARGMGLGDVKLAVSVAGLAGWWGWGTAFSVILLSFLASGLIGAVLLASRRANRHSQIPLGPSFIAAMVAMLMMLAAAALR